MENNVNSANKKLNNFIVQGGILAFAGVLARMLGLIKRISLTYIIGDVGNSYFSAAYEVYNIVLTISSYSIPLAMSKLISAKVNKGQYKNARKYFNCAFIFAIFVGLLSAVLVFVFSGNLSLWVKEPMSYMALRVLAPTLFVVAVMGVFRGFFQGNGTMIPTACSQLIEQIILIAVSLSAAVILFKKGTKVGALLQNEHYANAYGAAGATLGCCVGALAGLIFLIFVFKANKNQFDKLVMRDFNDEIESTFSVYKALIFTLFPIVISAVVNNVSNILDLKIHNTMMDAKGLTDIKSVNWGIYSGKYLVLVGIVIAMANAMGASTVPSIVPAMKRRDFSEVRKKVGSVIRITMMVSIPCAVGMGVLAPSIMYLIFSSTNPTAYMLLRIGAFGIAAFSLSTLTNSILQGMNKLIKPITHGLIALVIHVSILICLLKFTNWNIYAVAFSNNIFSLVICILNVYSISKLISFKINVKRTFVLPLVAASIMGVCVGVIAHFTTAAGYSRILILINILVGIVVYFLSLFLLRGITKEDLLSMPGGTRVYAVLNRLHIM